MRALLVILCGVIVAAAVGVAVTVGRPDPTPQHAVAEVVATSTPSPTPAVLTQFAETERVAQALVPLPWGPAPTSRGVPPPGTSSVAVVLLDDASGAVLLQRNGYAPLAPASLTKIATAVVAIEQGNLDAVVENDIDFRTLADSSVMGLLPGDRFTLRDLLYGLMLPSGNDAALAISRSISESDEAFVAQMNALAHRLGLHETQFENAHGLAGLHHYASAYDLALLSRYAMTLPAYREIASSDKYTAHGPREIELYSLVRGARKAIPGADGSKSGYTKAAGHTLVISVVRDGRRLDAVVMNDDEADDVAAALIEWGFANFDWGPGPGPAGTPVPTSSPTPPAATATPPAPIATP